MKKESIIDFETLECNWCQYNYIISFNTVSSDIETGYPVSVSEFRQFWIHPKHLAWIYCDHCLPIVKVFGLKTADFKLLMTHQCQYKSQYSLDDQVCPRLGLNEIIIPKSSSSHIIYCDYHYDHHRPLYPHHTYRKPDITISKD